MTIEKLNSQIREFINSKRRQSVLLNNTKTWHMLCSSLDLVGDTQLAIESYPEFMEIREVGASYLVIYGILQALLIQQDAAQHIGDALNIKLKRPKDLEDIRVIRNSAAGHPTLQKEKGLSKSCFITRASISPESFRLMVAYSGDKEYEYHSVSIPSLIRTQEKYLSELLNKFVAELKRQEMEHREKHKSVMLSDSFPQAINYYFSKIFEATLEEEYFFGGISHLEIISEYLDAFKNELSNRGEWNVYDSINYRYELIEYPLKRLHSYFSGNNDMGVKDAYIYTSFIADQVKSLIGIAKELDEMYASTT